MIATAFSERALAGARPLRTRLPVARARPLRPRGVRSMQPEGQPGSRQVSALSSTPQQLLRPTLQPDSARSSSSNSAVAGTVTDVVLQPDAAAPECTSAAAAADVTNTTSGPAAVALAAASASGPGAGASSALRTQAADGAPASLQPAPQPASQAAPLAAPPATLSPKPSTFMNRVIFGALLGLGGAAVIAAGALPFLAAALFVSYQATQEYYGFIAAKAHSRGVPPPPLFAAAATSVLCLSITLATYASIGRTGTVLSASVFLLLALHVLGSRRPTLSHLTSSAFGLFYCGYLPSFWVKLRSISVPGPELAWPALAVLLPPLTVGLVATLTAVACVIAADTGAYFVGKNLGRTKLTDISPKKTVEGAAGGMASAVAVALLMWRLFGWPGSAAAAAGYGVLTFFSSLFGDLIESIMKRDAGLKDSGDLIPGHGGLLDRFDSYMFTGAMAYFYISFLLPRLGVL